MKNKQAEKKSFNAAIVGCGRMGCTYDTNSSKILSHCKAYSENSSFKLVALCDEKKDKAEKCAQNYDVGKAYENSKEMLEKEEIDVLSICTTPESHYKTALQAIDANVKAIFCEKPFTHSSVQAEKIVNACEQKGILLAVHYSRRWDSNYQKLQQFLSTGGIGELQHASLDYCKALFNNGSHAIDLLCWLLGKPVESAFAEKKRTVFGSDPDINAMIFLEGGISASLNCLDYRKYSVFQATVFGSKGAVSIKDDLGQFELRKTEQRKDVPDYKMLGKPETLFKKAEESRIMNAVEDIAFCLAQEEGKKPRGSGKNAVYVLKVIDLLLKSAENRTREQF